MAKKRQQKRHIKPIYGWVGIINIEEIDLDPYPPYGMFYRTKKEARQHYQVVRRAVVKVY